MNLIVRNLLHVLRRFKLATILNILGLSVAFAAFMIIMMQLKFDFSFDRFHEDYDKIFRLEIARDGTSYSTLITRPLAEGFIASSPHIISGARMHAMRRELSLAAESGGQRNYFQETMLLVTPEFVDVFTFDFVEGTNASIIIPLSLSQKLFGDESAIGKHLFITGADEYWTVGGVYRDFPGNSMLSNGIYIWLNENQNRDNWANWAYQTYIRVNDAANIPMIIENFKLNFTERINWQEGETNIRLTALPDIHFVSGVQSDPAPKASRQVLIILFAIGIIIIIIAVINFTNFSMALMPIRIKNINTQRVMGAQRSTIRRILVVEALVFCFASYLVAVLFVELFGSSPLKNLTNADLSIAAHLSLIIGTVLLALFVGIAAGLYPSRYITSFAPALALKGNFGLSPKGKKLRNTLIGVQFVASFVLIIGTSFMYLQSRFMQHSDLGYNTNALIVADIGQVQQHRDAFAHRLKEHPGIETITYAGVVLSSQDSYGFWGLSYKDELIRFSGMFVHYTFLPVMGIEVVEGRNFRREDSDTEQGVLIFNETARQRFDLELNTIVGNAQPHSFEIIGFIPDIYFASFRVEVEPQAFVVWGTQNFSQAYIQLVSGANSREVMAYIRSILTEFEPNFSFEVRFFDEVLQQLYEGEIRLNLLITLFSLIAIFISLVGVFGLVVFNSECRRKEIGIRKVLGASTIGIITMFNKTYVKMLLICFVIAAPLAWYAVSRWLENFAYRTPMYWWIYLLAFITVAAITVLTVTIQNWRVANDDPVKSIKTE
jgi:putative ABC transport system permease protein